MMIDDEFKALLMHKIFFCFFAGSCGRRRTFAKT